MSDLHKVVGTECPVCGASKFEDHVMCRRCWYAVLVRGAGRAAAAGVAHVPHGPRERGALGGDAGRDRGRRGMRRTAKDWERACRHFALEHEGTHRRVRIRWRRVVEVSCGWTLDADPRERHLVAIVVYVRRGELVDEHFEWDAAGRLVFHCEPMERGEP